MVCFALKIWSFMWVVTFFFIPCISESTSLSYRWALWIRLYECCSTDVRRRSSTVINILRPGMELVRSRVVGNGKKWWRRPRRRLFFPYSTDFSSDRYPTRPKTSTYCRPLGWSSCHQRCPPGAQEFICPPSLSGIHLLPYSSAIKWPD